MPESFQVDLDGEQVLFDGTWYAKEDLAQKIRAMVDGGDYRISRPSSALEALQNALSGLRSLTLRLPVEQAEALAGEAARQGMAVGAFTRELILRALPAIPPVVPIALAGSMRVPQAPSAFQSGPVEAIQEAATPAEAAGAIPLTPKRREENDAEQDWFKQNS
jgi:hypothetical protein